MTVKDMAKYGHMVIQPPVNSKDFIPKPDLCV